MAKAKLFDTTRTLVDLKAVADLDSNFYNDTGHQRPQGQGLEDFLVGTSSISVNTSPPPVLDSLMNNISVIPERLESPYAEDKSTSVITFGQEQESIVSAEPLLSDPSETFHGKGKGGEKGQEKPFDLTSRDSDVSRGHQGRDPVSRPDNGKPDLGDRGGGPPEGKGPSGDHGGGEPEETAGNNLSFPVIWSENGSGLTIPGTAGAFTFTTPYDLNGDGQITDADKIDGYYQFAQKTEGNLWQAEIASVNNAPVYITEVDWGDSLESVDMKVGRPIRIELSLYKNLEMTYTGEVNLPDQMLAFPMTMLANPSSPDEVQGAGAMTYPINGTFPIGTLPDSSVNTTMLTEATVYSAGAQLIIQKLEGSRDQVAEGDLLWNGSQWVDGNSVDPIGIDISDPLTGITFAGELNVGGKVIYGLSQGGWQPTELGDYRITFYIAPNANAQLDYATIRLAAEEDVTAIATEEGEEGGDTGGGTAVVVGNLNLTYIDISVVSGGGIGGHESQTDSLGGTGLDFNAIASEISGLTTTESNVVI